MEVSARVQDCANTVVADAGKAFSRLHGDKFAFVAPELRRAMLLQFVMSPATLAGLQTEKSAADAAEWMLALYAAVMAT